MDLSSQSLRQCFQSNPHATKILEEYESKIEPFPERVVDLKFWKNYLSKFNIPLNYYTPLQWKHIFSSSEFLQLASGSFSMNVFFKEDIHPYYDAFLLPKGENIDACIKLTSIQTSQIDDLFITLLTEAMGIELLSKGQISGQIILRKKEINLNNFISSTTEIYYGDQSISYKNYIE